MKILSAAQTRQADAYTIAHEPIASLALMERAAGVLAAWLMEHYGLELPVLIFCGPGNNGGDGLVIARLLHQQGYEVRAFVVTAGQSPSPDFSQNLERLPQEIPLITLVSESDLPEIPAHALVLDGLFGTGLSHPLEGIFAQVVAHLNASAATVIAIDIPSGLYSDAPTPAESPVVEAAVTVTFEYPKLAFLLPQSGKHVGHWVALPIGLHPQFLAQAPTPYNLLNEAHIQQILRPRQKFTHKGTYGHALLVGGSYGKMGAITLSAQAALRAGVGLLTVQAPRAGYTILQVAVPEAMALPDAHEAHISEFPEEVEAYQCIGMGPGMGQAEATARALEQLFSRQLPPLVLDADALNLLAADRQLLRALPAGSILSPHPKEFERLTGPASSDFHRLQLLKSFCQEHQCYVVLKGYHTCIGTPSGEYYFNVTGNPGMATGGTGDVLTGILTSLRAQGYSALETCQLGVYLHGLAGDLAAAQKSEFALVASDVSDYLGAAFLKLLA